LGRAILVALHTCGKIQTEKRPTSIFWRLSLRTPNPAKKALRRKIIQGVGNKAGRGAVLFIAASVASKPFKGMTSQ
jgi:hypothetical protein